MKFQGKSIIRKVFLGAFFTTLTAGLVIAQVPAGARRPAAVPANYLITPFGYFHPSCVGHLAKGDELMQDEKAIKHANFFFNDTATTEIYTLSLHDALPI